MTVVGLDRYVQAVWAVVLTSVALYLARPVLEPIAFALFGMALVWPFQKAIESRMPKPVAIILSVLLTLFVIVVPVSAIVWSVVDILHWIFVNVDRFQSMYTRTNQWLEQHHIFISESLGTHDVRTFITLLQQIAMGVNYLTGFFLLVLLLLMFGLLELSEFKNRLAELESKTGWNISQTTGEIARRLRKYMLIRTIASALTGLAVFAFTLSIGLELAIAWGIISFVLNYIPYLGPLIAVILPVLFATAQFESWQMVVVIFGGLYAIQALIGNYLEPVIAGKALAISPLAILVAFFFWAFLWGIPGAFIGVPMTIALYTLCEQHPSTHWIARLLSSSDAASRRDEVLARV